MAQPAYLNAGSFQSSASATSITPPLPTGRVNGNVLIATVRTVRSPPTAMIGPGGGWTELGSQVTVSSALRISQWWRIVDGTEVAPTISWTSTHEAAAQIHQYSRENFDTASAFGAVGAAGTGFVATHTSTGFNTTRNNSLAIYADVAQNNNALAQPAGWTENSDGGTTSPISRIVTGSKGVATSGTGTGNISVAGGTSNWIQRQYELLEPRISGAMAASEASDTVAIAGDVLVRGALEASEAASDSAGIAGDVLVRGALAVAEAGQDTAIIGNVFTELVTPARRRLTLPASRLAQRRLSITE